MSNEIERVAELAGLTFPRHYQWNLRADWKEPTELELTADGLVVLIERLLREGCVLALHHGAYEWLHPRSTDVAEPTLESVTIGAFISAFASVQP